MTREENIVIGVESIVVAAILSLMLLISGVHGQLLSAAGLIIQQLTYWVLILNFRLIAIQETLEEKD